MPKIQTYQPRTTPTGSLGPQPNGGGGEGLQILADGLQAVNIHDERVASAAGADALSSFRLQQEQKFTDAQQSAKPAAEGFHDDVLKNFDSDSAGVTESVSQMRGGKFVTPAIKQQLEQIREHYAQRAIHFEATQRVEFKDAALTQAADRNAQALEADPTQFSQVSQEMALATAAVGYEPGMRAKRQDELSQVLATAAGRGVAKQDPKRALEQLKNPTDPIFQGMNEKARAHIQQAAENQLVTNSVNGIVSAYQKGQDAGTVALGELSKSDLPGEIQTEVRSKVNEAVSQLRTQRRQENANTLVSVEDAIARDTAGRQTRQQVESLYSVGALTPLERANYQAQITRSQMSGREKQVDYAALQEALTKGMPLDPSNAEHRKALDNYFAVASTGQPVGSESWQAQASALAGKTRLLPSQASAWTRQAMRSPDARVAAEAAQFVGNVEATAPDASSSFDAQTKAFASTVNSMIAGGTDPLVAAQNARQLVFEANPAVIEFRKKQFNEGGKNALAKQSDSALATLIGRDFDPGFFHSNPGATQALATDFTSQTEKYYELSGDINAAHEAAWKDLKRIYGPSKVNGSFTVMAFPPERYGVPPETVRDEIATALKEHPQADQSKPEEVILVPDSVTQRQIASSMDGRGVRPSYRLVGKSGDLITDKDGIPLRYTLPGADELNTLLATHRAADAAKQVEEAKAQREILRQEQERRAREFTGADRFQ